MRSKLVMGLVIVAIVVVLMVATTKAADAAELSKLPASSGAGGRAFELLSNYQTVTPNGPVAQSGGPSGNAVGALSNGGIQAYCVANGLDPKTCGLIGSIGGGIVSVVTEGGLSTSGQWSYVYVDPSSLGKNCLRLGTDFSIDYNSNRPRFSQKCRYVFLADGTQWIMWNGDDKTGYKSARPRCNPDGNITFAGPLIS